jgi:hypothetical protein
MDHIVRAHVAKQVLRRLGGQPSELKPRQREVQMSGRLPANRACIAKGEPNTPLPPCTSIIMSYYSLPSIGTGHNFTTRSIPWPWPRRFRTKKAQPRLRLSGLEMKLLQSVDLGQCLGNTT